MLWKRMQSNWEWERRGLRFRLCRSEALMADAHHRPSSHRHDHNTQHSTPLKHHAAAALPVVLKSSISDVLDDVDLETEADVAGASTTR